MDDVIADTQLINRARIEEPTQRLALRRPPFYSPRATGFAGMFPSISGLSSDPRRAGEARRSTRCRGASTTAIPW